MKNFDNLKNSFAIGAFSLTLAAFLTKFLGVLYKIPLSYILTDEGMGYFNSAYTVYGLFYIISTAGVPKAVTMLTSELRAEGKSESAYTLYKYLLSAFGLIGGIITVLFIILSPSLSLLIGTPGSFYTMLVIAPTILFVTLSGVIRGHLNAETHLLPIAISQLIEAACKLVLGIIFAYIGARLKLSLAEISAFTVFGITLGSLFSALYLMVKAKYQKAEEKTGQKIKIDKRRYFKKLIKIAIPITLSSSVLSITGIIDTGIIIRGLCSLGIQQTDAVAAYGNYTTLAFPMLNLITSVLAPISTVYLPRLREKFIMGSNPGFTHELSRTLLLVSSFAAPCALSYFFYSFELLDILFSANMSAVGAEMLIFLSPSVFILPVLTVLNTALEARTKLKATLISIVFGSLLKLVLSYVLITCTSIGILSAPISTGFSYLLSLIISFFYLGKEKIYINVFKHVFMPVFLSTLSFSVIFLLFYLPFSLNKSAFSTVICVGISFIFYLILLLICLKLSKSVKNQVIIHKKQNNLLVNR